MRIQSLTLPEAALSHRKAHISEKAFPGTPAEKANEAATSNRPFAEKLAASATANTERPAKNAPKGLDNAVSRLEAKDNGTKGIEHALEVLTMNLAKYQLTPPASDTATSA